MITRLMVLKLKFWCALAMGAIFGVLFPDAYQTIQETIEAVVPLPISPTWRGHGG